MRDFVDRRGFGIFLAAFALFTVLATLHKINRKNYNNYLMFTRPYDLLLAHENLYVHHPAAYKDLYKYSPTFPLFMMPFRKLPDAAGAVLWNLLNALLPFYAAAKIFTNRRKALLFLLIIAVELFISIENFQSNGVMTSLFLLAFVALENERSLRATLFITIAAFVKIFGIGTCALFPCYKGKLRLALGMALWTVCLFVAPLAVIPAGELLQQYASWGRVVRASATGSQLSVMGFLEAWLGKDLSFAPIQAAGIVLLLLPLSRIGCYASERFRRLLFASILIFVVIFNQMAESPTFVIAMAGVAIWFLAGPASLDRVGALAVVILMGSLSQTDLFPRAIRTGFLYQYRVKVIPMMLVWLWVQVDLWLAVRRRDP